MNYTLGCQGLKSRKRSFQAKQLQEHIMKLEAGVKKGLGRLGLISDAKVIIYFKTVGVWLNFRNLGLSFGNLQCEMIFGFVNVYITLFFIPCGSS